MEHWAKMGEEKCVSTWSNSLFMETVSLAYSIKTEDLYRDRSINKSGFNFGTYPAERSYYKTENLKWKMKRIKLSSGNL